MTTMSNGGTALQALMAIADRYAHRLVAGADAPTAVLLIERAGDLDVVMLDGERQGVVPRVRLLLARSKATSAALLVEAPAAATEAGGAELWIVGESHTGETAGRRYRVRPCGRARRLTPLTGGEHPAVEGLFRPLFPVHVKVGADDGVVDAPAATGGIVAA